MGLPSSPQIFAIPPEILLTIISHLPTKSFLPLVQTCHSLKSFFSSNAATICNTHITKHYFFEASILSSTLVRGEDGQYWLTPTHSMILPNRGAVLENTQLHASANPSLSTKSISPSQKENHMADVELRLREIMCLGVPGPLYLSFLETMGWDLRMRLAMFRNKNVSKRYLDEGLAMPTDDDPEQDAEEAEHVEYFAWAVERYITSTFGLKCSRFIDGFVAKTEDETQSKIATSLLQKVKNKGEQLKHKFRSTLRPKHDVIETRGLLFGEIEKIDGQPLKSKAESATFVQSLLWYYGRSGVLEFQDHRVDRAHKTGKLREYVCNVKVKMAKVNDFATRPSMSDRFKQTRVLIRDTFRRYRCAGGFELLE